MLAEGEICRYVTFVESGLVRYYINKDGEEQTSYFNKEGEFVCFYPSFLPQKPSMINIQVVEDCRVWMISFEGIQQFPQYHIASYVGVKPQSLSRIRKRLSGGK